MPKNNIYSIADLLPHTSPMILLDHVESHTSDFIHTSLLIKENTPFLEKPGVPSYIALEYMAQTVAAWNGLIAREKGEKPKVGFLLGARRLTLDVPVFMLGDKLDIYGQTNYTDGEIAAFDCWVEISGKCVAKAGLNVFQPSARHLGEG